MLKFFIFLFNVTIFFQIFADSASETAFTNIYKNKVWGTNEHGDGSSGGGSTLQQTTIYRNFLQNFLKAYDIKSVVDAGCGDWTFSRSMNWSGIDYIGVDVVKSVIDKNISFFEKPSVHFIHEDLLTAELPSADLLICKDVLQHLPNEAILKLISQFKKYKYCLITNDVDADIQSNNNFEIKIGQWRPIDLTCAPFFVDGVKLLSYRGNRSVRMKQVLFIRNEM